MHPESPRDCHTQNYSLPVTLFTKAIYNAR